MKVDGKSWRTIWGADENRGGVEIIDQTALPHAFRTVTLETVADAARAIKTMQVRGAPLIGVTAAYGLALAMREDPSDANLHQGSALLLATRPTAVNLRWAVERMNAHLAPLSSAERAGAAWQQAAVLWAEDIAINQAIGQAGLGLLRSLWEAKGCRPLDILTHCNAGWLATVDWGTALAPVYMAHDAGLPLHVWVDETRPRNQGASLTAWELGRHGVPHTVIVDNAGGHLMQHGRVDLCLVGSDRTTRRGDVCNKIGTYLKALAAHDNGVPFYVALPGSTIDWTLSDGIAEIPIEQRGAEEISHMTGRTGEGTLATITLTPPTSAVANYAFDVTPARLVTGLITERGLCPASGLSTLFPEHVSPQAHQGGGADKEQKP
ncbi:MAG: methylthioribose-1-phosphate isomerase [Rhodospirillaceae bacterium]|nr:MAG: methylthioribose-1-phosphate isomerase [Rhodospirillaceae bacterium]